MQDFGAFWRRGRATSGVDGRWADVAPCSSPTWATEAKVALEVARDEEGDVELA